MMIYYNHVKRQQGHRWKLHPRWSFGWVVFNSLEHVVLEGA